MTKRELLVKLELYDENSEIEMYISAKIGPATFLNIKGRIDEIKAFGDKKVQLTGRQ